MPLILRVCFGDLLFQGWGLLATWWSCAITGFVVWEMFVLQLAASILPIISATLVIVFLSVAVADVLTWFCTLHKSYCEVCFIDKID